MNTPTQEDIALWNNIDFAIHRLRLVNNWLGETLRIMHSNAHKNMREIAPGVWLHNDFKNLPEAMAWLKGAVSS